jgi:SAM-dependent methyltransferase
MNYWLKHFDSNVSENPTNFLKQVGKTVNGVEVDLDQINIIIDTISSGLLLEKNTNVVDLCCGNGILTKRISEKCNQISGVDYSSKLIKTANEFNKLSNITYINSDITVLGPDFFKAYDMVYMYEGLQHITMEDFYCVLTSISMNHNIKKIFLGGIPDKELILNYYDTDEKWIYYQECENKGRPHIGKWWEKTEIEEVSQKFGFNVIIKSQDKNLYSSYYRFDCLLERE